MHDSIDGVRFRVNLGDHDSQRYLHGPGTAPDVHDV